jgi:hypothetical protein
MPQAGCFTPRKKIQYPLCKRLGGTQGWAGQVQKISPLPEFDPWIVQPVATLYTNYALLGHLHSFSSCNNNNIVFFSLCQNIQNSSRSSVFLQNGYQELLLFEADHSHSSRAKVKKVQLLHLWKVAGSLNKHTQNYT